MEKSDYTVEPIYQGSYSTFKSSYGESFTGYHTSGGDLGVTTDPRTANIIADASTRLSSGAKHIELSMVTPEIFDSVPKQQLKEMNRLAKLTGAEVSVHAPVIDSAGMSQQGWSEAGRETAERRISDMLLRSNEVNDQGNVPVVFHSAEGIPSSEWETLGPDRKAKKITAIDKETGQMRHFEGEVMHYPKRERPTEEAIEKYHKREITKKQLLANKDKYYYETTPKEGVEFTAEDRVRSANRTTWDDSITQLTFNKERVDEILKNNELPIKHLMEAFDKKELNPNALTPAQNQVYTHVINAKNYLEDIRAHTDALFHKAYKHGTELQRMELDKLSNDFKNGLDEDGSLGGQSMALQGLMTDLKTVVPEILVPVDQFAIEKSSQSFGNAAFNAYSKLGDKAPIMCIENPPAGFAISTGEDLKELVDKSREQFAQNLVKEKGIGQKQAEKTAEKFIGATWDVGHINMLRKQGFSEEDIVKQTEIIAPVVKHVHLSDNFGYEHTELPMGMGNVPLKEMMERLGEKGFEAKKVIEAAQWYQHFKTNPLKESMEGMGASFYSSGTSPYWNQSIGLQQGYLAGYGMMLPQTNYQMFGAGFSQLPGELGGQAQGAQGNRMSGRPME